MVRYATATRALSNQNCFICTDIMHIGKIQCSALLNSEGQTAIDREYTVQVIQLDIERTFPQLCIFQKVRHLTHC